jgi:iron(III)-enterobactin esterase
MATSSRCLAHSAWLLGGALALGGAAGALGACSVDSTPEDAGAGTGTTGGSAAGTAAGGASGSGGVANGGSSAGGVVSAGSSAGGAVAGGGSGGGGSGGNAGVGGSNGVGGMLPEVSAEGDGDITVGPTYMKDPNLTDLKNPKGKRFTFTMKSSDSAIFKGMDATLSKPWTAGKTVFNRGITVYVPDQYKDGTEAPILVIQDGGGPIDSISRALDNLTISNDPLKKLPPFVAIAVQNGSDRDGSDGQGSERGLEYDTMSDRYSTFIDTEVLPAVVADPMVHAAYPGLKFTKDPNGRGAFGCSSGGAAALSMGWFAPNLWRRIVTYSGTFVDQQNHAQTAEMALFPFGAWEYHSDKELIKNTDNKPLRIFINANENDNGATGLESGHHNWVMANQRTAAALAAKKYHYQYVFAKGLGHCAGQVQDQTIATALSWAWRGYVAN